MSTGSAHKNKKFASLLAIRVGNELIRRSHDTKYLGLIVDDTLKWDLHIDHILQTLQNRAARVVMGIKYEEANHDLLLASSGRMNVKQIVCYKTASLMYKITDGTTPEYTQSMFDKCDTIHSYETRSARNGNFITPKMTSAKGQTAFVYSGAQVWNSLPLCIKEARSVDIFQERLKEHIFVIGDF